jgi:hypothetical protein
VVVLAARLNAERARRRVQFAEECGA